MYLFYWKNSYTGKTTQTGVRVSPGRGWYEISRKEYNAQQSVERTVLHNDPISREWDTPEEDEAWANL